MSRRRGRNLPGVKHVRNVAIILVLALIVAVVPGGGNVADGILAAVTLVFLVLIGWAACQFYRQNRLSYLSLDERWRVILLCALGVIVLMIAGADELLETGLGLFAWLGSSASRSTRSSASTRSRRATIEAARIAPVLRRDVPRAADARAQARA